MVIRPPIRSVSQAAVCITWLWFSPWSMMPLTATRSTDWAATGVASRAAAETKARRRDMEGNP
ncbi:hypothetical protein MU852_10465 [Brevundimonas albigilva]|uniref:hypothetical protein n=1 Tax=Brevundimonas albigilva TaxID=1312364 RepID=UPI00201B8144|nr:hypothetical protein [Brevundimonas albigilva]UQV17342.1 hypothetical protein MU852_10465 [Brevundimonas albigilva]